MLDSNNILQIASDAKTALDSHGFFELPRRVHPDQVTFIKTRLNAIHWRRTPLSETNKSQYWLEANLQSERKIQKAILSASASDVVAHLEASPTHMGFWANCYGEGEFIPRHTDNDGGLQMLTGIELTPDCSGGEVIFHHNGTHSVLVRPGHQVLFDACRTAHETRPLFTRAVQTCRRVVCVTRFYF